MKILQYIQNDVVVNPNDVIRIAYCDLNIESTQPVAIAILRFEWTLYKKVENTMQCNFNVSMVLKMPGLKD